MSFFLTAGLYVSRISELDHLKDFDDLLSRRYLASEINAYYMSIFDDYQKTCIVPESLQPIIDFLKIQDFSCPLERNMICNIYSAFSIQRKMKLSKIELHFSFFLFQGDPFTVATSPYGQPQSLIPFMQLEKFKAINDDEPIRNVVFIDKGNGCFESEEYGVSAKIEMDFLGYGMDYRIKLMRKGKDIGYYHYISGRSNNKSYYLYSQY